MVTGEDIARVLWWFKDDPPRAKMEDTEHGPVCLVRTGMGDTVALFTNEDKHVFQHWFRVGDSKQWIALGRMIQNLKVDDRVGRMGVHIINVSLGSKGEAETLSVVTNGDLLFENEADAVAYQLRNTARA